MFKWKKTPVMDERIKSLKQSLAKIIRLNYLQVLEHIDLEKYFLLKA